MMTVFINNEPHELESAGNLADVLAQLNLIGQKGIAVAVNNIVIPKNNWNNFSLNHHDKITVITATQGG